MRQEVAALRQLLDRERSQVLRPAESSEAQIRQLIEKRAKMLQSGVYAPHDLLIRQLDERVNQLLVHETFDGVAARAAAASTMATSAL